MMSDPLSGPVVCVFAIFDSQGVGHYSAAAATLPPVKRANDLAETTSSQFHVALRECGLDAAFKAMEPLSVEPSAVWVVMNRYVPGSADSGT